MHIDCTLPGFTFYWSYCPCLLHAKGLLVYAVPQKLLKGLCPYFTEITMNRHISIKHYLVCFLAHLAKGHVSLWDGVACVHLSVHPSAHPCISLSTHKNNFSDKTTGQILMKLVQKHVWLGSIQVCRNHRSCLKSRSLWPCEVKTQKIFSETRSEAKSDVIFGFRIPETYSLCISWNLVEKCVPCFLR